MKNVTKNNILKKLWHNQICRHTTYWFCGYTFFFLNIIIWETYSTALKVASIIILPGFIPVYLHFYLHKRFFEQRKYLPYVFYLLLIIIGSQFLGTALIRIIENDPDAHTSGAATAIFFIVFTTAIKYYRKGVKQQIELQQAQSKQLQTELALLKSQVNPHFFFNTLNNLYALSLDNSERVPEVILKIADLMRYVLESSKNSQVELTQEIDFLRSYLSLEKLRFSADSDIKFNLTGNTVGKIIAPMLLIPFIENSFKHGASSTAGNFYIHIDLKIKKNRLFFSVENNKRESYISDEQSSPKSGLKNIQRRLELLYPNKYNLDIIEDEKSYKVNLEINL